MYFLLKMGSMAMLVYQRVARSAGLDQTAEGITPNGGDLANFPQHRTQQFNTIQV